MAKRAGCNGVAAVALVVTVLGLLVAFTPAVRAEGPPPPGFSIADGRLIDAYGNDFVMRGINHPHGWFEGELAALDQIKATGANSARVVLSSGHRYERTTQDAVSQIVQRCRDARLVCVLELHDTTGFGDVDDAISLDQAIGYWTNVQPALTGHEGHILINVGNEPFGNSRVDEWLPATATAIEELRAAGFAHTLMVDAPNWGQDWTFTMRDGAAQLFEADPLRNVMFDVHMYGVFNDDVKVRSYIESFVRADLPLVIGEFGATHTDGDPDEVAIMHWAEMYGIGYLGWSWSGNTDPVEDLNVVINFDATSLTQWGRQLLTSVRGIGSTSTEASIFSEPAPSARPLVAAAPPLPAALTPEPLVRHGRYEAEAGVRNGLEIAMTGSGFSAEGYLTGFDTPGDTVTIVVHAEHRGEYDLVFGYRSPYGEKLQTLIVDDQRMGSVAFAKSATFETVRVQAVKLAEGANRIGIEHDWGWFDLDYVEVWGPEQ